MYSSGAPGPTRGARNAPVNVPPQQTRGAPQPANTPNLMPHANRITDMLDQVKTEYEAAVQQLNITKMEQIEAERKLQAQLVEMTQIQQTLQTLEANHRRICQQYEDDLMRMRRQLEGQQTAGIVNLPAKRHRTANNSVSGPSTGGSGDGNSLMAVATAMAATSNRAGDPNPRSSSPAAHIVPVQAASRSLARLNQPNAPPQLSPLEGKSTTPTNHRSGPIPSLSRRDSDSNKNRESVNIPSGHRSQSDRTSPVITKAKTTNSEGNSIPSLSTGKAVLPSLNRDHQGSGAESSPSSTSSRQSQPVNESTPTGDSESPSNKQSNHKSNAPRAPQSSSSSSSDSNSSSKSSSSKGNKLNWNCVYNNSSSHPDSTRTVPELHQTIDHHTIVCCVRFSPDGSMLASGSHKTARVFDVKSGEQKFNVSRPATANGVASTDEDEDTAYVRAVAFSPDSTKLVAGMAHNTIRVRDIATNEEGPTMTGHESQIYSLDYVGDMIVSGSGDRTVRLWDARTGECKKIFGGESGGPSDGLTSVALSPDGRYVAAGSLDNVVRVWDTESSQLLDRCEGHSNSVYSIAFSPDGKSVISGSLDKNIMLWDVNTQGRSSTRPRMVFQGHKDFVVSVAYTPDGSSRSVLTLTGYRNSVISVASSPKTPYFATGSGDCLAVVWKY